MTSRKNLFVPTWWQQPAFKMFRTYYNLNKKNTILFIGSGLSRWKGLPDWKELLLTISIKLEDKYSAKSDLYNEINSLLNISDPKFEKAGTILKKKAESKNLNWHETVKSCLKIPNEASEYKDIHKKVASFDCKGIITTNFDPLIEKSYASIHEDIDVVFPGDPKMQEIEGVRVQDRDKKFILKLHGDIENQDSTIILTEEDYFNLYNENSNNPELHASLKSVQSLLRTNTILFLGFSHNDIYLNRYFIYALQNRAKNQVFALTPMNGDPRTFTKYLKDKNKELGVQFIQYSQDNNYNELYQFFEYFENQDAYESKYEKNLNIKIPTTIMLYCGGTIGSARTDKESLKIREQQSRFGTELSDISNHLLTLYKLPKDYAGEIDDSIDIIWEILPPEFQLFSENSTPELWNVIADKINEIFYKYFYFSAQDTLGKEFIFDDEKLLKIYEEDKRQFKLEKESQGKSFSEEKFLIDIQNRYILGIVLLTGTDTLSFTASAIAFEIKDLPCSIAITGANNPPGENRGIINDKHIYHSLKSDAWNNLQLSLYFLQVLGHRLREVFVCFGGTVHLGINLRKRSTDSIPFRKILKDRSIEPFIYRNLSFHSEYMFKLIDGIFCNNFYPRAEIEWFRIVKMKEQYHIRYKLRHDAPGIESFSKGSFSNFVKVIQINPSMPKIDPKFLIENDNIRAILVEGYASGTYPTIANHNFTYLLENAYTQDIPLILISLFGIVPSQSDYEKFEVNDKNVPVLTLYGIISETATTLLAKIVGNIPAELWDKLNYDARMELIKDQIKAFVKSRTSLVLDEIKYIVDKEKLLHRIEEYERNLEKTYENVHLTRTKIYSRQYINESSIQLANKFLNKPRKKKVKPKVKMKYDRDRLRTIFIMRNDFLFLIEELTTFPLEKIGLNPDGFYALNNAGYKIGDAFALKESGKDKSFAWLKGNDLFWGRTVKEKLIATQNAVVLLKKIEFLLENCGFANLKFIEDERTKELLIVGEQYIKLKFKIKKQEREKVASLKYETVSYLEPNAKFYHDLRNGNLNPKQSQDEYDKLLNKIWDVKALGIDWFVLGVLRGVLARIGILLRINDVAVNFAQSESGIDQDILQESVKLKLLFGDDNELNGEIILF